jgi:hypothetical protein
MDLGIRQIIRSIYSDFFINIAAGWFGAVFIFPITTHVSKKIKVRIVAGNLVLVILSLVVAFILRL